MYICDPFTRDAMRCLIVAVDFRIVFKETVHPRREIQSIATHPHDD